MQSVLPNREENTEKFQTNHWSLAITICGLAASFYAYEYFIRIIPSALDVPLRQYFGFIDAATFATVTAVYYAVYTPMQLPVGLLMDRYGPRRLLTFACFVCAVGTYLFVMTPSLTIAACGRFLMGLGSAFAYVGVLKLTSIWFPNSYFAFFAGTTAALGKIGASFGQVFVIKLTNIMSWMTMFYITAGIGFVLSFAIWLVIRDHKPVPVIGKDNRKPAHKTTAAVLRDMRLIFKTPQIWMNGLIGCLIYLPATIFGEKWGPSFLEFACGYTAEQAVYGVFLLFLGFIVGAPIVGAISTHFCARKKMLVFGALLATLFSCLFIYLPGLSYTMMACLLFLTGLTFSSQALVFAVACDMAPLSAAGTAVAVTNMFVMIGPVVIQPLIGYILVSVWDGRTLSGLPIYTASNYRLALTVIPIGIFISGLLGLFLKNPGRPSL